jgi:hypothetical protein
MKKKYKKPQVVEVKLTIQNPILGLCEGAGAGELGDPACQTTGHCAFP